MAAAVLVMLRNGSPVTLPTLCFIILLLLWCSQCTISQGVALAKRCSSIELRLIVMCVQFTFRYVIFFQEGVKVNPSSASFSKWSTTLKQFISKLPTNCLSVFDHFVGLMLKGLKHKHIINIYGRINQKISMMRNCHQISPNTLNRFQQIN